MGNVDNLPSLARPQRGRGAQSCQIVSSSYDIVLDLRQ
jgi:hypothetical protein